MPDTRPSSGLLPPATPISASPQAAIVRAAHLVGSLERFMLPVEAREIRDQQTLEACVSCASAAAMEIRHAAWPPLSPLFHYRAARIDRKLGNSAGRLTLLEGLNTLEVMGICTHALHGAPMTDAGLSVPLSSPAKADALQRRLPRRGFTGSYETVGSGSRVVSIRVHLKKGRPVLMGMTLPASYPENFLGAGHQWDDPSIPLSSDGHCVVVIGFDDAKQALRIQDSRGAHARFDKGCWWMGYAVADSAAVLTAMSLM